MDEIYSLYKIFLIFSFLAQLMYLSIVDIKFKRISNSELIPLIAFGIFSIAIRIVFSEIRFSFFNTGFFILHFGMSMYLYYLGFFGEVDLKLSLILFFIIFPTSKYGITSNFDGLQYYLYFFVLLALVFFLQFIRNVIVTHRLQYLINRSLSKSKVLYMYCFYHLRAFSHLSNPTSLILQIDSQRVYIQIIMSTKQNSICWVNPTIPMIPILTSSLILAIIT